MTAFSVGSLSTSGNATLAGQSFTPNVPGPNGSGSPGSATQVTLVAITFGFPSSDQSHWPGNCYLFSQPLDDPTLAAETTENRIAVNSDFVSGDLGSGTYSRKFNFQGATLNTGGVYYAYFANGY